VAGEAPADRRQSVDSEAQRKSQGKMTEGGAHREGAVAAWQNPPR
jgi:hypothetical protein